MSHWIRDEIDRHNPHCGLSALPRPNGSAAGYGNPDGVTEHYRSCRFRGVLRTTGTVTCEPALVPRLFRLQRIFQPAPGENRQGAESGSPAAYSLLCAATGRLFRHGRMIAMVESSRRRSGRHVTTPSRAVAIIAGMLMMRPPGRHAIRRHVVVMTAAKGWFAPRSRLIRRHARIGRWRRRGGRGVVGLRPLFRRRGRWLHSGLSRRCSLAVRSRCIGGF